MESYKICVIRTDTGAVPRHGALIVLNRPKPTLTQSNCNTQAYDTDSFNRWDAGNRLGTALILKLADMPTVADIEATSLPTHFVDAIRSVLTSCKVSCLTVCC